MPIVSIKVDVQAEAVGPVMIALRRMPGVMNFHVDLDAFAPSAAALRAPGSPSIKDTVIAILLKSYPQPLKAAQIADQGGLQKTSVHSTLHGKLKEHGVVELSIGRTWRLSDKAAVEMGARKLLSAPEAKAKAKANGKTNGKANGKTNGADHGERTRQSGAVLWAHLHQFLKDGAKRRAEIIGAMAALGMKEKGVSSLLSRNQRSKLVKSDGGGTWELTPKGHAKTPIELQPA